MVDLTREKPPAPTQSLVEANEQLVLALLQATAAAEKSAARLSEVMLTAHLDALTGLPDRTLFMDRFTQAIARARRHRTRLALLFVDLDQFKDVNDRLGHPIGDRVLRAAAQALQSTVRAADTVSRHGGDEFLILLTEISSIDGAEVIAHKLCDAITTSPEIAALDVRLTASIGFCVYPDDGDDAKTLIARADLAMYRAKATRSGVASYWRDYAGSLSSPVTEVATGADRPSSRPQSQTQIFHDGDERYQHLREANERLLIAALEAQTAQDDAVHAHPGRALIDHMDDGAITVDGDGNLLFCNRRFAHLVGCDGQDLVGTPFASFLATVADAQMFRSLLASAPTACASEEFALLDASGTTIPVNITVVGEQARGPGGAARIISAIVTDLRGDGAHVHALSSRLRQAVIERGRSERRLEIALEAAEMGTLEIDLASGVLGWTHRHDRIFGVGEGRSQVALPDLFEQVVPEDRALVEHAFADALTSNVIDVEFRLWRPDKQVVRWIHIKAEALQGAERSGRVTGVVTDITEKRVVADQLRRARKMEAVGELTSGIAHDFNNLLLVIGGGIEMLARRIVIDERTSGPLESARKAVLRGAKLNQRLLAFARQQDLHAEMLCLDDLVPGLVDLVQPAIGDAITIAVRRLPQAWLCYADRDQLEIAILNLAINGRDAMPHGGVLTLSVANVTADAVAVSTWGAKPGDYAAISVEDSGTGMALDVMTRAFEPFFTTKGPGLGTGLGLSQVYGFVRESGGFVSIDSELGRGTRMTIHLPRRR